MHRYRSGFTIIEIMVVLAVAGLILLIVFLAVPALEREARNTQRKHDASLIATDRQLYDQDNGTAVLYGEGTCDGTHDGPFATFCQYITQGLSYYVQADVTVIDNGYTPPTTIPTVTPDTVVTETYLTCNSTLSGATTVGADPTDAVILYAIETGGGQVTLCIPSGTFSSG